MTLELKVRSHPHQRRLRCAWCHDRIASAQARRCEGCNTLLHFDCARESGRCVSPGCSQRTPQPPQVQVRPRLRLEPRWRRLLCACASLTALLFGIAVYDNARRLDSEPQVIAAPSSPEMHEILVDVAEGRRGAEVLSEVLELVRRDPHRAHEVSQFSLAELLGDEAVPALRQAWYGEADPNVLRWILGAMGSCDARATEALPEIMEGVEDPRTRETALFVLLRVGYYAEEFPPGAETTLMMVEAGDDPYSAYLATQALQLPGFRR